MTSNSWAPYGDAIKLILTGATDETLTAEQKDIYRKMLVQGMKDDAGNQLKERHLPDVRIEKSCVDEKNGKFETVYFIPDLFRYMLSLFEDWNILNPPVNQDYLNSIKDELDYSDYVAYPKTLEQLYTRLKATPEELAAWVWQGPENGSLAAYLNVNELSTPPRFYYDETMGEDYLSPLMACWFLEKDIKNFQPTDRYITGKALIERWKEQPGIVVEAFIQAKISESRLLDYHPTCGGTQGSYPGDKSYPSLDSGLFVLSDVESVGVEDFGKEYKKEESTAERKQRLNSWYQEECELKGEGGALARTAKREGITRQTLSDILKRAK